MPNFFTFYVLRDGDDNLNDGLSWERALATLQKAIELTKAGGAGRIKLGAGTWPMPTFNGSAGSGWLFLNVSNMSIEGMPGRTVFKATNAKDGGFIIGSDPSLDPFTLAGGVYRDIHLFGITIDMTITPNEPTDESETSISFGQVENCSMRKCAVLGGRFMCTLGGNGGALPATRIVVEDNDFKPDPRFPNSVIFASVNSLDCQIIRNRIINRSAFTPPPFLLDLETNVPTDYNSNLLFAENTIDNCGPTQLQVGSLTDIGRSTGNRVVDNYFRNSNGINCGLPGTIIARNIFRRDKHATQPATNWAINLAHVNDATMYAPDGCVIEGNVFENMGTADQDASIIVIDSSFNKVLGNVVRENRELSKRGPWVVEEVQRAPCLLSGGATGVRGGMTIDVAALQIQGLNAGSIITRTAQSKIVSAASPSDRVDSIVVRIDNGDASVVPGDHRPTIPDPGGTPVEQTPPLSTHFSVSPDPRFLPQLPLAAIDVPANATSLTSDNIRDYRYFAPSNNVIDQDYPPTPMARGTVKLISPLSYRVPRRKPAIVTDPYDQLVLHDAPRLYLPMMEQSGPLMADLSGPDNDGISAGGILFNQSIADITGAVRQGATFDGVSGFVQVESRPEIVSLSDSHGFTIEVQLMPSTFSVAQWIVAKGIVASGAGQPQFALGLGKNVTGSGNVRFFFENRDATSTRSTTTTALTHLVVVWDGTNVLFYFNGDPDPIAPTIVPPIPSSSSSTLPVLIGGADTTGVGPATGFFTGTIRKVALYSGVLSPDRITDHVNSWRISS